MARCEAVQDSSPTFESRPAWTLKIREIMAFRILTVCKTIAFWTLQVCKTIPLWAVFKGFGPLFCILSGSR